MTQLICPSSKIQETIQILQDGGRQGCETVALWLGRVGNGSEQSRVEQVYRPTQRVAVDFFHIPPESMRSLMQHLREHRLRILAQVHSHPQEAFHSHADDTWAIVRHEGALSLVLPHFASTVTEKNFLHTSATFRLSAENQWLQIPPQTLTDYLEVAPC